MVHALAVDLAREEEVDNQQKDVIGNSGLVTQLPDGCRAESQGEGKSAQHGQNVVVFLYEIDDGVGACEAA